MSERLTPEREAEFATAVAELDADRALSFGTWTASPVTEKTTLPPEQAFAVEDVARMGSATVRGSVGVFGDERHAAFTALAREAVPALLAELAAVRAERDQAQAVLEAEKSAHRFTLRQRNNRSTRLQHLRDLANTAATTGDPLNVQALIAACRDTLAASVNDHKHCAEEA